MDHKKKTRIPPQTHLTQASSKPASPFSKKRAPTQALIKKTQRELYDAATNLTTGLKIPATIETIRKITQTISASYPKEAIHAVINPSNGERSLIEICAMSALFAWESNKTTRDTLANACLILGRELAALGADPNAGAGYKPLYTPCSFCIIDDIYRGGVPVLDFFHDIGADINRCDHEQRNLLSLARDMNNVQLEHRLLELGACMPPPVAALEMARLARQGDSWDDWKQKLCPVPDDLAYYLVLKAPRQACALWGLQAGVECLDIIFHKHLNADKRAIYLADMCKHFDMAGQTLDSSKLPHWKTPEVAYALGDMLPCITFQSGTTACSPENSLALFATRFGFDAEQLMAGFSHRSQLLSRPSPFNDGTNIPDPTLARAKISEHEEQILLQATPSHQKNTATRKRQL